MASDLSRVSSLVISRVLSVSCAICRFSVPFTLGSSSSILRTRPVTIYLRLISHWYRARMWLLVVAVLRHDEDSFELTSVAQLRRDWVVAHMPARDTMVSSRFQGGNARVHFCLHFRGSRHAKVGLGFVEGFAAFTSALFRLCACLQLAGFPGSSSVLLGYR